MLHCHASKSAVPGRPGGDPWGGRPGRIGRPSRADTPRTTASGELAARSGCGRILRRSRAAHAPANKTGPMDAATGPASKRSLRQMIVMIDANKIKALRQPWSLPKL